MSYYSVKKPLTVFVIAIIVVLLGFISLNQMQTDLLPTIEMPFVMVVTPFPGASPERVEREVTVPLESALQSLQNLEGISSISQENASSIRVDLAQGTDVDKAMQDISGAIDGARASLASGAGEPTLKRMTAGMMPVMVVGFDAEQLDRNELTQLMKEIMPRLERVEGVASIESFGMLEQRLQVRLDQQRIDSILNSLNRLSIGGQSGAAQLFTKQAISGVLAAQNFSMPAGYINGEAGENSVKVGHEFEGLDQIQDLVLLESGTTTITLNDVADLIVADNSAEAYAKVADNPAIICKFSKQDEASTPDVSAALKEELDQISLDYSGLRISVMQNQGNLIGTVTGSVVQNLLMGGVLAIIVLIVFLGDIRPTIVIAMSIPLSLMAAIALMYFSGVTINIISLGGLALAVGMLVDNSIVAIENIYRLRGLGMGAAEAAMEGAKEITGPLVSSTLTTVCVFMPILFIEGMAKQIIRDMALTIAFSLMASLLVAITLVPAAAAGVLRRERKGKQGRFDRMTARYRGALAFCLSHRALVLLASAIVLALAVLPVPSMGMSILPSSNSGEMSATISMPENIVAKQFQDTCDAAARAIADVEGVYRVGALQGGSSMSSATSGGARQSNEASLYIMLDEDNRRSNADIRKDILEKTSAMGFDISVSASAMDNMASMMTGGSGMEIEVKGSDLDTLATIGADIGSMLGGLDGVYDIYTGQEDSIPETRVTVDAAKAAKYGLTATQVFQQVAMALTAEVDATDFTINGRSYPVVVTGGSTRLDEQQLQDYTLTGTVNGSSQRVKVSELASFEQAQSPAAIYRDGSTRMLTVTAEVEDDYNISLLTRDLRQRLDNYDMPGGYAVAIVGEEESIGSTMRDLGIMIAAALVVVYLIMVAQFQSLLSPFIIMFTIPLAFTGGMIALFISGSELSLMAMLGFLMLAGVVVNNGIVFVDYTNELIKDGMQMREALVQAGMTRMRPILMTALTTILGLSTMALGIGSGSEILQPLAIVVIGGLVYATVLTLIVVPVIYSLLIRQRAAKQAGARDALRNRSPQGGALQNGGGQQGDGGGNAGFPSWLREGRMKGQTAEGSMAGGFGDGARSGHSSRASSAGSIRDTDNARIADNARLADAARTGSMRNGTSTRNTVPRSDTTARNTATRNDTTARNTAPRNAGAASNMGTMRNVAAAQNTGKRSNGPARNVGASTTRNPSTARNTGTMHNANSGHYANAGATRSTGAARTVGVSPARNSRPVRNTGIKPTQRHLPEALKKSAWR